MPDVWITNSKNQSCTVNWVISNNASSTAGGVPFSWSPQNAPAFTVPANTSTPTKFTANFTVPATTLVASDQFTVQFTRSCTNITWYYGSTNAPTKLSLPTLTGGSGGTLATPPAPTGLTVTPNADGTRTLTWTAPTTGTAVDFYRIYRDGTTTALRADTQGVSGNATDQWVDLNANGSSHTYRVTAVSANLAESPYAGPISG